MPTIRERLTEWLTGLGAAADVELDEPTAPDPEPAPPAPEPTGPAPEPSAAATETVAAAPEPPPARPAPARIPAAVRSGDGALTMDKVRTMRPAEINARWEEVSALLRG